jgi:hypothetical protein
MAFPTDARNHYKAIKSEINLSEYNSQIELIFNKKIMNYFHLGGTKNKTDVKIVYYDNYFENITLKTKKNIKSGSFDWVNTTSFCKDSFVKSFEIFNKYKGSNNTKNKSILEDSIKDELKKISSDELTKIFLNEVCNYHLKNNLKMLVIDETTKKIYLIKPKIFNLINDGFKLILSDGNGRTSSKVLCQNKDGDKIDLGLRIRVHLNNGWTKWNKGESSVLCLKFQQDAVYKMLN